MGAWRHLATTLQAALDDDHLAARRFDAGPPGEMRVDEAIDRLVTGDIAVHTWDLGRAVGLDDTIDPELCAQMLAAMQPIDDLLRQSGHYGPKVAVADDADTQTKLIAFTGRDPHWRPPA